MEVMLANRQNRLTNCTFLEGNHLLRQHTMILSPHIGLAGFVFFLPALPCNAPRVPSPEAGANPDAGHSCRQVLISLSCLQVPLPYVRQRHV
jgi:hypothetical protein